ncbi:MAG: hypothetical protein IJW90_01115 [Clostridia bacterium]|nr:hypothetical protein [Clostridia bacterium]
MKIKLSPCPFCGGEAKLVQMKDDAHKWWADGLFFIEVNHNWGGEHRNKACILYAAQFGHYRGGYDKKTGEYSPITEEAKEACKDWNTRKDMDRFEEIKGMPCPMPDQLLLGKYVREMEEAICNDNKEAGHICCDEVMCDLLRELGYGAIVEVYDKQEKWYS